jgi:hypothetical protein
MAYVPLTIATSAPRSVRHFIETHVDMQFADVHAMLRLPIDTDAGLKAGCNFAWHSTRVTGLMRPDPSVIKEFVWGPVAELAALVFVFGAPWFPILEKGLGLRVVDRLGLGGRKYPSTVASRSVTVLQSENGVTVIAEKHQSFAGPPNRVETLLLREELDRLQVFS